MRKSARSCGPEVLIPTEIELKLAVDPVDLPALTRAVLALGVGCAKGPRRLVSTYFDTPDFALQRAAMVLRVREQDGGFVQTIKTADPDSANLFGRGEWEHEVAGNRPELDGVAGGVHPPVQSGTELRAIFVTDVERTAVDIKPEPGAIVEAAIDRGSIRTPGGEQSEPVNELELELKMGAPSSLYGIALKLLKSAPLRLDLRSKSERGFHLIGKASEPVVAHAGKPLVLTAEMTVETALQQVGLACLKDLLRAEPAALAGHSEGVHQMRVSMRRLRSMLSAVKGMIPEEERRRVLDDIKQLTRTLGPARNLDVFVNELVPPAQEDLPKLAGWDALAGAAERARSAAYRDIADDIAAPGHTAGLLRLLQWFEAKGWYKAPSGGSAAGRTIALGAVAPELIERRRRRVEKRRRGFRRQSPQERHRLRIAVKKWRYALELFVGLYDQRETQRLLKRLKRVQDQLGHANDVHTTYRLILELGRDASDSQPLAGASAALLAWHERRLARRDDCLRRNVRRLDKTPRFWRG